MSKIRFRRMLVGSFCVTALAAGIAAQPGYAIAQPPYRVIDHWKIGGEGFWDYLRVDPVSHRLFIAHDTQVQVVDTKTGKLVGAIDGLNACHGIAFDTAGKFGFISNGFGKSVIVFDRASLAKIATIENVGANVDGIAFEPVTQTVWTFNGDRDPTATVIDAAAQKIVGSVPLGGGGESAAIDGKGNVYGNVGGTIVRIDARSKAITAQWPTGCTRAFGLAVDVVGHRLFQACAGKVMAVVDSETGKVLATSEIGDSPDGAGWNAKNHLAFATSGDGFLTVLDANAPGYPAIEKLATMPGAKTLAYDPDTDRIYAISAEAGPPTAPANSESRPAGQQGPPPAGQGPAGPPPGEQGAAGAAPSQPRPPRPSYVPGSFSVIVIGR